MFGLDLLGWIAFLILWGIQMVIVAKGWRRSGTSRVGGSGDLGGDDRARDLDVVKGELEHLLDAGRRGCEPVDRRADPPHHPAVGLTVGVLATLMLNFSDFARFSPSPS